MPLSLTSRYVYGAGGGLHEAGGDLMVAVGHGGRGGDGGGGAVLLRVARVQVVHLRKGNKTLYATWETPRK